MGEKYLSAKYSSRHIFLYLIGNLQCFHIILVKEYYEVCLILIFKFNAYFNLLAV